MRSEIRSLALAAVMASSSCGKGEQPVAPAGKTAIVSCGEKPAGIDPLLAPGALTIFGEMHGTTEIPAFVANVACHAADAGREVIVGLEIPNDMRAHVDQFLASGGTPGDLDALLQGSFWHRRLEDGRSSKGMLALLDRVRLLKRGGKALRVVLIDAMFEGARDRDSGMGASVSAAIETSPRAVVLILVGNVHARTTSEQWMGWHLAKRHPGLRSLDASFSGGSAWVCMSDGCGPTPLWGLDRGTKPFVELATAPDDKYGYSGSFYVGAITASLPATHEGDVPPSRQPVPSAGSPADRAYDAKDYSACGRLYLEAADFYNAACCQALAGDVENAAQTLQRAIDGGFSNVEHLKTDADLESLHGHPRWKALLSAAEVKAKARNANANQELASLFREDQADRQGGADKIDWAAVRPRDAARRKRVREIMKAGGLKAAADYFSAAMVLQHGDEPDDYRLAHELAAKAAELDPENDAARWLAAAAKDRLLMSSGKPQLYGTQYVQKNGTWELYEVDPSITDEERARWNVPPLAEAKRRAEEMNQK